ncbi:MAG: SGNH/GDSL hydrolase family protein [Planctomycetota bacterium]|jgi:lysophospholipase L1-like esterase
METKSNNFCSVNKKWFIVLLAVLVVVNVYCYGAFCASERKCVVEKGDYVVIAGDSITERMKYSSYMETYLLACEPEFDIRVTQLGWGGETAGRFRKRMDNDLMPLGADVVTLSYGMNDGRYRKYKKWVGDEYIKPLDDIVSAIVSRGGKVVVGSPGPVDSYTWDKRGKNTKAAVYNESLTKLAGFAKEVADKNGQIYAPINEVMNDVMVKAKARYGQEHHVAGADGVHPAENGHLAMAYTFLKAMGFDGEIGTITVEWGKGAKGTEGHEVVGVNSGNIEVISKRYPFCFHGPADGQWGTVSVLEFLPFQEDLNRFKLVVNGLPGAKAKVKWGDNSKEFSREELAKGINLAAEFLKHPLCGAFERVREKVGEKQQFERFMIKQVITHMPSILEQFEDDKEIAGIIDKMRDKMLSREIELQKEVRSLVVCIKHVIEIEVLE